MTVVDDLHDDGLFGVWLGVALLIFFSCVGLVLVVIFRLLTDGDSQYLPFQQGGSSFLPIPPATVLKLLFSAKPTQERHYELTATCTLKTSIATDQRTRIAAHFGQIFTDSC